jgi:hypothetical protein
MDPVLRRKLERIAWNHADGSRDDEERWSFLFRTEGAVSYNFFPLHALDGWEFDGDLDGLDLPWTAERMEEIEAGAALDEVELEQWRWAKCRALADGTDWTWVAWLVPLRVENEIAGYAAFLCSPEDNDPSLHGVFETQDEAEQALSGAGGLHAS